MLDNERSFSLKAMAKALKVTRSGYYQWKKARNTASKRSISQKARDKAIKDLFVEHKARAGARRIQKDLEEAGMPCCLKTIGCGSFPTTERCSLPTRRNFAPSSMNGGTTNTLPNHHWNSEIAASEWLQHPLSSSVHRFYQDDH